MDNIIGNIEILMMLFLAYCAIAIPYYYLKKIYFKTKGLKKIFSIFLIFNLTFVNPAHAEAIFVDNFDMTGTVAFPTGLNFNNDGTKMFVIDQAGSKIDQFVLSAPFNVLNATHEKVITLNAGYGRATGHARGIFFNNDGTKMFIVGRNNDTIDEYTLTNPFDIASSNTSFVDSFNTKNSDTGNEEEPSGIHFNNDGTKMFFTGSNNDDSEVNVYEYNLSTGFDISTSSFSQKFDISNEMTLPRGLTFSNDGTKMFITGSAGGDDEVNEYILTTGFDISTSSFLDRFDLSGQDNAPTAIRFNNTGTKMYVVGNKNKDIYEYSLSCPFKVTSSSACDTPLKNKDVKGIIDAQINTAKKFAKDSSQSAFKRLSILRANKYENTSTQNIELLFQNELFKKASNKIVNPIQAKLNPLQKVDQILPNDWEVWSEGSISFGKIGDSSLISAQDIDSIGITMGVDTKMDNDQILGVALRLSNSDVDVGISGSAVDTNALSLSIYGINSLEDENFLKHVFGVSYLDSDIVRKNQGNTVTQTGDRKGKQVFGSLDFGREYKGADLAVTPICSIDGSYTTLNGYTESGEAALNYNDLNIKSLVASLGVLIDEDIDLENSNIKSRSKLKYSKDFASNSKVVTSYVSDSESFEYQADNKNRDIYTVGLGFDFKHDQGLTISTDYERQQIKGHGFINKFTLSAGFLYKKETQLAFELDNDMTSNFKVSKALGFFDLEFNLENDFSNQENHKAILSLSSKF